ncbi:MAG: hypothetical protein JWO46_698 [Nocardioidaceae bacterium]|nr:hypothetical protein [Nocardioidaceae bacterium]
MTSIDDIVASLPIDAIAQQVGARPADVQQAVQSAVPALVGGLHANAQDPAGADSLIDALGQHSGSLADAVAQDPAAVQGIDTAEGQKIAAHIFGDHQQQVVNQLGGLGGGAVSADLVKKLIPILAPIVMSYVAKQVASKGGASAGDGVLDDVLGQVLKGAGGTSSGGGLGSVLGSVLGGLLGGGRRK